MADKEVFFYEYCPKCKHYFSDEEDFPCCYCLSVPARPDSHKPEYFKERENEVAKNSH